MKIYQTNAALGYNQLAYLIKLDKTTNGYNYLCIGTNNVNDDSYEAGKVVEDLEDYLIQESNFQLNNSPLYGTYLFNYFISRYITGDIKYII